MAATSLLLNKHDGSREWGLNVFVKDDQTKLQMTHEQKQQWSQWTASPLLWLWKLHAWEDERSSALRTGKCFAFVSLLENLLGQHYWSSFRLGAGAAFCACAPPPPLSVAIMLFFSGSVKASEAVGGPLEESRKTCHELLFDYLLGIKKMFTFHTQKRFLKTSHQQSKHF